MKGLGLIVISFLWFVLPTRDVSAVQNCGEKLTNFLRIAPEASKDWPLLREWARSSENLEGEDLILANLKLIDELRAAQASPESLAFAVENLAALEPKSSPNLISRILALVMTAFRNRSSQTELRDRYLELVGALFVREPGAVTSLAAAIDELQNGTPHSVYWNFVIDASRWALRSPGLRRDTRDRILWELSVLRHKYLASYIGFNRFEVVRLYHELNRVSQNLKDVIVAFDEIEPKSSLDLAGIQRKIQFLRSDDRVSEEDIKILNQLDREAIHISTRLFSAVDLSLSLQKLLDYYHPTKFSERATFEFPMAKDFYIEIDQLQYRLFFGLYFAESLSARIARHIGGRSLNQVDFENSLKNLIRGADLVFIEGLDKIRSLRDRVESPEQLAAVLDLYRRYRNMGERLKSQLEQMADLFRNRSPGLVEAIELRLSSSDWRDRQLDAELAWYPKDLDSFDQMREAIHESSILLELPVDLSELPQDAYRLDFAYLLLEIRLGSDGILIPAQDLVRRQISSLVEAYRYDQSEQNKAQILRLARYLEVSFHNVEARIAYSIVTSFDRFILYKRLFRILDLRDYFVSLLEKRPGLMDTSLSDIFRSFDFSDPSIWLLKGARDLTELKDRQEMIRSLKNQGVAFDQIPVERLQAWGSVAEFFEVPWGEIQSYGSNR